MAFINMIIGGLIWESIRMVITMVITLITIGHFRNHLWNKINSNTINHDNHADDDQQQKNVIINHEKLFKSE